MTISPNYYARHKLRGPGRQVEDVVVRDRARGRVVGADRLGDRARVVDHDEHLVARDFGRGGKGLRREAPSGRREFAKSRRDSHEEGIVRLKINKGRANNIRPNDIVGQIAFHANIPGSTIGKIRVEDKITFVDIPEDVVDQVLRHSANYKISRERFSVVRA